MQIAGIPSRSLGSVACCPAKGRDSKIPVLFGKGNLAGADSDSVRFSGNGRKRIPLLALIATVLGLGGYQAIEHKANKGANTRLETQITQQNKAIDTLKNKNSGLEQNLDTLRSFLKENNLHLTEADEKLLNQIAGLQSELQAKSDEQKAKLDALKRHADTFKDKFTVSQAYNSASSKSFQEQLEQNNLNLQEHDWKIESLSGQVNEIEDIKAQQKKAMEQLALSISAIMKKIDKSIVTVYILDNQDRIIANGSGVVIQDRTGASYVLTNDHVVSLCDEPPIEAKELPWAIQNAKGWPRKLCITPYGADRSRNLYPTEVVMISRDRPARSGTDRTDLALLRIPEELASQVKPAEIWDITEEIPAGHQIFTAGCPYRYQDTVSEGIVSNAARSVNESPFDFLQITASIFPGNSGGGAFSIPSGGKLVGINRATEQRGGGNIGFALPAKLVKQVLEYEFGIPVMSDAEKAKASPEDFEQLQAKLNVYEAEQKEITQNEQKYNYKRMQQEMRERETLQKMLWAYQKIQGDLQAQAEVIRQLMEKFEALKNPDSAK